MIEITDTARDEAIRLLAQGDLGESAFIRVSVKGGGCSGLMYDLDFDNKLVDGDKKMEDNGLAVVVDKKSLLYLIGTQLDFSGGLNGKGFQFINPNASRTCGCGESFAV